MSNSTPPQPAPSARASPANAPVGLSGARVLVAEDEPSVRHVLTRALNRAGAEVIAVEDAQAAIDAVQADTFDIVLLDMRMPCGGGVHAFREIAALRPELAPRTVFMTGALAPDMSGIVDLDYALVMTKPFQMRSLIGALAGVIRGETTTTLP